MNAEAKLEHERRIEAQLALLEARSFSDLERKMVLRYKKIRFFERRKAERRLKKLQRAIANGQKVPSTDQIECAILDLYYTLFYPKTTKYIALYADSASTQNQTTDGDEDREKDVESAPTRHCERQEQIRDALERVLHTSSEVPDFKNVESHPVSLTTEQQDVIAQALYKEYPDLLTEAWRRVMVGLKSIYEQVGTTVESRLNHRLEETMMDLDHTKPTKKRRIRENEPEIGSIDDFFSNANNKDGVSVSAQALTRVKKQKSLK